MTGMEAAFARVQAIATGMGLPGITPGTSYGTPSLKAYGKFLGRIRDEDTLVIRCPLDEKAFLIDADPDIFFETPHYHGYDAVLLRLHKASDATIAGRIEQAWRHQVPARVVAAHDKGA